MAAPALLSDTYAQTVARSSPKQPRDNAICQITDDVARHQFAPDYRQQEWEQGMSNSNAGITRTNAEPNTQWLKDNVRIKARLADCIDEDHGHKHSHLKLIARTTGASPRTVEKWKDAQYLMGVEHFLRLVPSSPAIQRMLAELMTLDADTDPRHGVLLQQIQRAAR